VSDAAQHSPQPAEEQIALAKREIDRQLREVGGVGSPAVVSLTFGTATAGAVSAALRERRELREALQEAQGLLWRFSTDPVVALEGRQLSVREWLADVAALLAQPAAREPS
jgi:hypothetical protein